MSTKLDKPKFYGSPVTGSSKKQVTGWNFCWSMQLLTLELHQTSDDWSLDTYVSHQTFGITLFLPTYVCTLSW